MHVTSSHEITNSANKKECNRNRATGKKKNCQSLFDDVDDEEKVVTEGGVEDDDEARQGRMDGLVLINRAGITTTGRDLNRSGTKESTPFAVSSRQTRRISLCVVGNSRRFIL